MCPVPRAPLANALMYSASHDSPCSPSSNVFFFVGMVGKEFQLQEYTKNKIVIFIAKGIAETYRSLQPTGDRDAMLDYVRPLTGT